MNVSKRTDGRKKLGRLGEEAAAEHLLGAGYRIVERNWRCPSGELDLIAEHDGVTIFVEVRSRRDTGTFGSPEESIDARKRKKVRETAGYYLYRRGTADARSRFDVITVLYAPDGTFRKLNHLINVF